MPRDNLSIDQRKAIKELKQDEDIVILPADKGNTTVILSKEEYVSKLTDMIGCDTYKKLKKDPTRAKESNVTRELKNLERTGELNTLLYNKLRPCGSKPPLIYGLPKVHKEGVPLRPIVSCTSSPTYQLSKYVSQVISPLAGSSTSHVKNSAHFVEEIKSFTLSQDDIQVSFDVKSLFTNVPIKEAVDVIFDKMTKDAERTSLLPERVTELLELCLGSTYFGFQGEYYDQVSGAAMGSPVSAVVANIYMEFFEELAISSSDIKPRIWKRHVDDIWCVLKNGSENVFLEHLNNVRPSIQFTMQLKENGVLPFLDCELHRRNDRSLDVTVFRKPTHTDRYMNFRSHHPEHVRRGVVKSLFDRARRVVTGEDNLEKEYSHLNEVFKSNGYPDDFIAHSSKSHEHHHTVNSISPVSAEEEKEKRVKTVVIPYTKGFSEDTRRVCRRYDIRVSFKVGPTLGSWLTRVKDVLPVGMQSKVAYEIPCSCGKTYIGETVRRLETRIHEHQTR